MTSTMRFDRWEDSTGALIAEGSAPRGIVTTTSGGTNGRGYSALASSVTSAGTTVDVLSMTFNATAGRLYRASALLYIDTSVNSARYEIRFTDASNTTLKYIADQTNGTWARAEKSVSHIFTASGSTTIKLRIGSVDGNMTVYGISSPDAQVKFYIEDIGPA